VTAPAQTVRPLPAITAAAWQVPCKWCYALRGDPCDAGGAHLMRVAEARRGDLVSELEFGEVIAGLPSGFHSGTVIGRPDCAHLHSVLGAGCPWCAPAAAGGAR
jgi:hypothetical protein